MTFIVPSAGGAATLTVVQTQLPADVAMVNANQFYDGPAVVLVAGVWLVSASLSLRQVAANVTDFTLKLWDGVTPYAAVEGDANNTVLNGRMSLSVIAKIALGAGATIKASVASTLAGSIIRAGAEDNGVGITTLASTVTAVKIG